MENRKRNKQGITILVLSKEGDKQWERLMAYLRKKGADVYTAPAANDAYAIIKKYPVNVVIIDYDYPKIKALNVMKRIKKLFPHVEIIFLSSEATLTKAIEAMKEGAYDFYEFPVNLRLLTAVIDKAVEKQSLHVDKIKLEKKIIQRFNLGKIVGRSKAMQHVIDIVSSVASKNVNVLLTGETGTGKEMIAQAVHYNSPRSSKPFIGVNCAALSEGILESELFGHEKGSFTGAVSRRIGRFELAHEGTLFLDEIGDMPLITQIKLLRVLQERSFERVGGNQSIKVDVRVIAATHQDLKKLINEGNFRKDLYYRLNIVNIELPSLRNRKEDIPLLVSSFIHKFNEEKNYGIKGITRSSMQILLNYKWPGNVRELENAIESAMALATTDVLEAKYLPSFLLLSDPQEVDFYQIPQNMTLRGIEQEIITQTLAKTGGNKSKTARLLGIGLRTLQRKVKDS
jgi:DNA-binding NtrC family response regulator